MFSNPEKNVDQIGLTPTMHVADLGAGSGAYSLAMARAVSAGKVYAIDVQKDLLVKLKNEADSAHIHNIEVIAGNAELLAGTHLREGSIDVVLAANILFQVPNKHGFIQEMKRILKKGGRAVVIDWSDSFGGIGPQASEVVTQYKATELFEGEGFESIGSLSAGDHHYGIIFKRP